MRVNFRKGDIVRDTLEGTGGWVGLVVEVKGQVAEVYYPQHSGRIWMPFDTLERVTDGESTLNRNLFPEQT